MLLGEAIESYYSSPEGLRCTEYTANEAGGNVETSLLPALRHQKDLDRGSVDEVLDEVGRNLRLIEHGGSSFEISTANNSVPSDELMLHISTFRSALTTNPGNAYEFAAQAVRYPNHKHLYVASFGNGGTAPLLPDDTKYTRLTGRFTYEEGDQTLALQSIQNLRSALAKESLDVTNIMGTDSAGGHYARALCLTMESGQLSHAFFSETSGFVNLSTIRIIGSMMIQEARNNARQNRDASPDPEMMDNDKITHAKQVLDKYNDSSQRQTLHAAKVSGVASLISMWNSMQALRRGPTSNTNPLLADTNAVISQHPQAKIVYGLAEHDPLYLDSGNCRQSAFDFLIKLAVRDAPVKAIIVPGVTHAYNTYFPSLYHSVKKYALEL
jgi:hypothetical protein